MHKSKREPHPAFKILPYIQLLIYLYYGKSIAATKLFVTQNYNLTQ